MQYFSSGNMVLLKKVHLATSAVAVYCCIYKLHTLISYDSKYYAYYIVVWLTRGRQTVKGAIT